MTGSAFSINDTKGAQATARSQGGLGLGALASYRLRSKDAKKARRMRDQSEWVSGALARVPRASSGRWDAHADLVPAARLPVVALAVGGVRDGRCRDPCRCAAWSCPRGHRACRDGPG